MAINRKKIIDEMSKIKVVGDENGLIEGFNVLVNQLPADFWNGFAERLTNKVSPDLLEQRNTYSIMQLTNAATIQAMVSLLPTNGTQLLRR
jgi:hypothetical protein